MKKMTFPTKHSRQGKYNNRKCEYKGMLFDSERERDRYIYLEGCQRRGLISGLRRQVWYTLLPDEYADVEKPLKTKVKMVRRRVFIGVRYKADFVYFSEREQREVVEDTKISPKVIPKDYQLKEKMMHSLLHIDIRRVYKPTEPV